MQEKNRNLACISSKQVPNTLALNLQIFCQQIDKKNTLWWNKMLNMFFFFHKRSYKNGCYSELAYNTSAVVLI